MALPKIRNDLPEYQMQFLEYLFLALSTDDIRIEDQSSKRNSILSTDRTNHQFAVTDTYSLLLPDLAYDNRYTFASTRLS